MRTNLIRFGCLSWPISSALLMCQTRMRPVCFCIFRWRLVTYNQCSVYFYLVISPCFIPSLGGWKVQVDAGSGLIIAVFGAGCDRSDAVTCGDCRRRCRTCCRLLPLQWVIDSFCLVLMVGRQLDSVSAAVVISRVILNILAGMWLVGLFSRAMLHDFLFAVNCVSPCVLVSPPLPPAVCVVFQPGPFSTCKYFYRLFRIITEDHLQITWL